MGRLTGCFPASMSPYRRSYGMTSCISDAPWDGPRDVASSLGSFHRPYRGRPHGEHVIPLTFRLHPVSHKNIRLGPMGYPMGPPAGRGIHTTHETSHGLSNTSSYSNSMGRPVDSLMGYPTGWFTYYGRITHAISHGTIYYLWDAHGTTHSTPMGRPTR